MAHREKYLIFCVRNEDLRCWINSLNKDSVFVSAERSNLPCQSFGGFPNRTDRAVEQRLDLRE